MLNGTIRWSNENFIGSFDNRWVVKNGSISDGFLTLNRGGKATLVLTNEVNVEFKYVMLIVTFYSDSITAKNNYKNKPTIFIKEVYKNNDDSIDRVNVRSLGFNTHNFNEENKRYTDETIFTTLDRKMSKFKIEIRNEIDNVLTIYDLKMFQSVDVSESQVSKIVTPIVNQIAKEGSAEQIKVYRNEDGSINGLGVFIQGSKEEIKFRPAYFNGQLIAIDTNYGQTISIQNIMEAIDLTNSSVFE